MTTKTKQDKIIGIKYNPSCFTFAHLLNNPSCLLFRTKSALLRNLPPSLLKRRRSPRKKRRTRKKRKRKRKKNQVSVPSFSWSHCARTTTPCKTRTILFGRLFAPSFPSWRTLSLPSAVHQG